MVTRIQNSEKGSPLGIMTKCQSSLDFQGLRANAARRAEKYSLQNHSGKLLPKERVCKCLKMRITKDKNVGIRYNETRATAHYDNLQRCGSIWICPVCAAQISEGRRQELKSGINGWTAEGGSVYLLTLTNPHHYGDNLQSLLTGQKNAIKYLWGDRKTKERFALLGKVGHIITTEVTHGKNGWHPHYHILLFFRNHIDVKALRAFIAIEWQNCCKKAKLKIPSIEHGVDLQDGTYADKYVSKWGLEDEMTKGHTKRGREGSSTPWDLLRLSEDGCERSGRLFQQYAVAFKGKRQLHWSRGLKALLLVEETTDEQLATETEKESLEVRTLDRDLFKLVVKYKLRASVLRAVELEMLDGYSRVDDLIMEAAIRESKENIDQLMKDENFISLRYQTLALAAS